jgi:type VI protein secretion system component Hcp
MKTATKSARQNEKSELSAEQLDSVSGGDQRVTKPTDKSTASLFAACCTGKHFS